MRTDRLLLWIVLGASAAVCADSGASVLIPNPGGMAPISEIQVTPSIPSASSETSVTVCGWKPASNYGIYDTDLRIEDSHIWLDLYWHVSGIGLQAFMPYEHTESLGTLDPGMYTLQVTNRGAMSGSATITIIVCGVPGNLDPGSDDPDPDPSGWLDLPDWFPESNSPAPSLPGFEIVHVPISDVGGAKDGISQLRIEPTSPKSSDEVRVTVSGWKPRADLDVKWTTRRTEGNEIWLDLHWLPRESAGTVIGCSSGLEAIQSVTVIQLDVTSYSGVPFAYTESLGTFGPGTYTLHVTNHSPMTGSASILFTVLPSSGLNQQPSWWQCLLQGTK